MSNITKNINSFIKDSKNEATSEKEFIRKPKNYHVVGIRFRKELYNKVMTERIQSGDYEDISKYVKALIEKDLKKH